MERYVVEIFPAPDGEPLEAPITLIEVEAATIEEARLAALRRFADAHPEYTRPVAAMAYPPHEVREYQCPRQCGGVLFRSMPTEAGPQRLPGSPPLESGEYGPFVRCPTCKKRVTVIRRAMPNGMPQLLEFSPTPYPGDE